jgi:hypothetical protein
MKQLGSIAALWNCYSVSLCGFFSLSSFKFNFAKSYNVRHPAKLIFLSKCFSLF